MRFDRKKPGGGVEIHCRLENGKAWLGWKFHIQKDAAEPGGIAGNVTGVRAVQRAAGEGLTAGQSAPKSFTAKEGIAEGSVASKTVVPGKLPDETYRGACQVEVTVTDREGRLAAYGRKRLDEEEPLETLLLHPHSWSGMEDPYLYRVEACLLEPGGCPTDQVVLWLPLREVAVHPEKGVLLNGKAFLPRAVRYVPPCGEGAGAAKALQMEQMRQEFLLLKEMGANCIHYEAGKNGLYPYFLQLCDKYGFVVWEQKEGIPCRAVQDPAAGHLLDDRRRPTSLYYHYRAKWGREPFVYLAPESIRRQENGTFLAVVYSNCSRVALYTDGQLHGILSGEEEFVFQEIPARHPCIMLSAEAEGCSMSLSLHKSLL